MSELRKAAQMALEALEHYSGDDRIYHYAGLMDSIAAIHSALDQPKKSLRSVTYVCPVCAASLERQE